jgi:MFS family permease
MTASTAALRTPYDAVSASPSQDTIAAVYRKVTWRLVPFLFLCYVVAFLDRINIGYAQLQMKQSLPFSDAVYGLGAGIFFIGYFLFEVPSNLMLAKVGARKTLLRIMSCWGVVAAAMMFVSTPTMFYVLRFFLGVFEAGFFPGVLLYLTYWYPNARRGRIIALFMSATAIAGIIAGPLSGGIMKYMDGMNGWAGWQWLFLVQGLPATLLGFIAYFYLQDKPEDARWLDKSEKAIVRAELDADSQGRGRLARLVLAAAARPQGVRDVADLLPAAGRRLRHHLLGAHRHPQLGRDGHAADRPLCRHPQPDRRDRHGAGREALRTRRWSAAGT